MGLSLRLNHRIKSYCVLIVLISFCHSFSAQPSSDLFQDDFSQERKTWQPYFEPGKWTLQDGIFTSTGSGITTGRIAKISPASDIIVDTEFQFGNSDRKNIGIILRAQANQTCYVVRYYDRDQVLELLHYDKGSVIQPQRGGPKIPIDRGQWYRFKVVAIDDLILAKLWPSSGKEPIRWQFSKQIPNTMAGQVGLYADDNSIVRFRSFEASWNKDTIAKFRTDLDQAKEKLLERMREALQLEVKTTSFVLRTATGPERLLLVRTVLEGSSEPVAGEITVRGGGNQKNLYCYPQATKKRLL